jgi:HSP20 family protein
MALELADPLFRHVSPQMSKILEQMQKGYYNFLPSETWQPNVNLYENDYSYVVCVDLAGVDKDKIDLAVVDSHLILRGARPDPSCPASPEGADPGKLRVHLMEIDHGSFAREVELPVDVHKERIHARYNDGMLWIELPKK